MSTDPTISPQELEKMLAQASGGPLAQLIARTGNTGASLEILQKMASDPDSLTEEQSAVLRDIQREWKRGEEKKLSRRGAIASILGTGTFVTGILVGGEVVTRPGKPIGKDFFSKQTALAALLGLTGLGLFGYGATQLEEGWRQSPATDNDAKDRDKMLGRLKTNVQHLAKRADAEFLKLLDAVIIVPPAWYDLPNIAMLSKALQSGDKFAAFGLADAMEEAGHDAAAQVLRLNARLSMGFTPPNDPRWRELHEATLRCPEEERTRLRHHMLPFVWDESALEPYRERVKALLQDNATDAVGPTFAVYYDANTGLPACALTEQFRHNATILLQTCWPPERFTVVPDETLAIPYHARGFLPDPHKLASTALQLARGYDANHQGPNFWDRRPVEYAAAQGRADLVLLLLAHGAELQPSDGRYFNPVRSALIDDPFPDYDHPNLGQGLQVAEILLERGARLHPGSDREKLDIRARNLLNKYDESPQKTAGRSR